MRSSIAFVAAVAALAPLRGLAAAADRPVSVAKLQLQRAASGREKLVLVSKDPTFPFPAVGGSDDPAGGVPGGLQVEVFAANESLPGVLAIPPGSGRPGWTVSTGKVPSYRYTNPSAPASPSPVKVAVLKAGRVAKVVAADTGLALAAPLGRVVVRVTIGSLRACAILDGASVRRDAAGSFLATRATAAPVADCSDAALGVGGGSTTTTTLPPDARVLDFTTVLGAGSCGRTRDGGGAVLRQLTCGGLDIGGGAASVVESQTPDGGTNRFLLGPCTGSVCTIGPWPAAGPTVDCTAQGCSFGPPLPIPNGGTSTCVVNTLAAAVSGSIDLATGSTDDLSLPLASALFLTGNPDQPCPRCSAAGTPGAPGSGTCVGGANPGAACTSTNSQGLSRDCPPGGVGPDHPCTPGTPCADGSQNLGTLPVDLTPLATGARSRQAADGLFCPGQTAAKRGCFNSGSACRAIELSGVPAGPLEPDGTVGAGTFASIFCIPSTSSPLVNFAADLPGPGASTLVGTLVVRQAGGPPPSTTTTTAPPTTTTVPTTTTTTAPSPTTTTTIPPGARLLDLTTRVGSGACGSTRDGGGALLQSIACGGLDLGGGASSVPEGLIPDGATNRWVLSGCTGDVCQLSPTAAPTGTIDCTGAGCRFGPPLPLANGGLSTCIVNTFASAATGSVDLAAGSLSLAVPLAARVFLTGDAAAPCPRCSASGSASAPGTGVCDRGANAGGACVSTNAGGLSSDCLPGGGDGSADLGTIGVDLTPAVTGARTLQAADGLFCPGQTTSNGNVGCFGEQTCRRIDVTGAAAGPLAPDAGVPATLAATFCIPAVGNVVIDGAASLPGPGAASLPVTLTLRETAGTTTTTAPGTTTTTAAATTTTTTSTTVAPTTTSSTLLPPLLPLTVEFASTTGTGTCGQTRDGAGALRTNLACGSLALGSGGGALAPSALPDGAVVHFALGGCSLLPPVTCALNATTVAGPGFDCTTTGCFFGPPVPIPNGALSACAVNRFSAPVSGAVNLLTGATETNVSLALHVFVTGNGAQPCPRCSAAGSPAAPGTGTCDRGANAGGPCTSTNSQGLSRDCLPGGGDGSVDVGTIAASLSPVTTDAVSRSSVTGLFCPGQTLPGCFGDPACRSISLTGQSPGVAITSSLAPQPATLVSTFCIPPTGSALLDGPGGLPGPAAISLPGLVRSQL